MAEINGVAMVHDRELQEKLLKVLEKIEGDLSNILEVLKENKLK